MGLQETIQGAVTVGFGALGNLKTAMTYSHPNAAISVSTTCTFAADGTITGATSFEAAGLDADMIIAVSGASKTANNQIWIIDAVDATEITVDTTYRAPEAEIDASATIKTVNYHPDSGTYTRNQTDYTINAVITGYSVYEVGSNPEIEANDRRIIFDATTLAVTPSECGTITIGSTAYEIRDISQDPAAATWEIRARKMG